MTTNHFSFPSSYGWNGPLLQDGPIARIINQEKGLYRIQVSDNESLWAQLSGKRKHEIENALEYPGVGDWVSYTHSPGDERAIIHEVLERKTCFYRGGSKDDQIVAANIDVVFIVSSANSEKNLNRLDRYMTIAWDSGAKPVIVLSKTDLCENLEEVIAEISDRHIGVDICPVTMSDLQTLSVLAPYLQPGQTVVLLGSSGVGKSTLTNALLGHDVADTGGIREDDEKGRHTTTSRQLYRLPSGALLMDTPGMRSLAMGAHEEGLEMQFAEITATAAECRFSDCQHQSEPDCAIRAALENDEIDPEQWQSYLKLQKEVYHQKLKEDRRLLEQERNKCKKVTKDVRVRLKQKAKGQL